MTHCDCLSGCPFFNGKMSIGSAIGEMYRQKYCLGTFLECARHQVKEALGKEKVPNNLYPKVTHLCLIKQKK